MKNAFGALDLLIALVIMAFLFIVSTNAFKGVSSINLNGVNDSKSIQQEVDKQVNEIENLRRQRLELENNFNNDN